ncbi:MAG: hypothetical protein ABI867_02970 [Kofleriaceae bacterium]
MLLSLELKTAIRCPECNVRTPLPGLRLQASCRSCACEMDVQKMHADVRTGGLRYAFGGYYDAVAEALINEEGAELRDAREGQIAPVAVRRLAARCTCEAVLPVPQEGAHDVICTACGDAAPVRWPDAETRAWDPRAWCVIGDAQGRQAPTSRALQGSTLPCGQCGAPLPLEGRRRTVTCTHCTNANFIADAAWVALYPQPEKHRCFLLYQIEDETDYLANLFDGNAYSLEAGVQARAKAASLRRKERTRAARVEAALTGTGTIELDVLQELARRDLSDAQAASIDARARHEDKAQVTDATATRLLARWAVDELIATRVVAARYLPASETVLIAQLAGMIESKIRETIAARTDVAPELIAKLRKDEDSDVERAAKANPAYQAGFFTKLFGG